MLRGLLEKTFSGITEPDALFSSNTHNSRAAGQDESEDTKLLEDFLEGDISAELQAKKEAINETNK